jgi:hypothetical protein
MKNLGDLFAVWCSLSELATETGVSEEATKGWSKRRRIPTHHWPAVISAACRKGHKISADDLLVMHAKKRRGGSARAYR